MGHNLRHGTFRSYRSGSGRNSRCSRELEGYRAGFGPNWENVQNLLGRLFFADPSEVFEPIVGNVIVGVAAVYRAALEAVDATRFVHARNAEFAGYHAGRKFADPRMRRVCANTALAVAVRDLATPDGCFTPDHYDIPTCRDQPHHLIGLRLWTPEDTAD